MPGITDPTEAYFKDGQWGWDGSQWRKLNLLWGYNDRYAEELSEIDVAAGTQNTTFATVPAGEVWVINGICAFCSTANPTDIRVVLRLGGVTCYLLVQTTVVAWQRELVLGSWVLKEGDYVRVVFTSCVLNDDIYAQAFGYKMKVSE